MVPQWECAAADHPAHTHTQKAEKGACWCSAFFLLFSFLSSPQDPSHTGTAVFPSQLTLSEKCLHRHTQKRIFWVLLHPVYNEE